LVRGTDFCVLVYDVTQPPSFESIRNWHDDFCSHPVWKRVWPPPDFLFLLLGNKADLPSRAVETSAASNYAEMNGGMLFYEVSAKTGENLQTAFEAVVRKALEMAPDDDWSSGAGDPPPEGNPGAAKGGCPC
jgi:Ras-related protein Rab-7A